MNNLENTLGVEHVEEDNDYLDLSKLEFAPGVSFGYDKGRIIIILRDL